MILDMVLLHFILGLVIGSFLNVVIYRLPIMLNKEYNSDGGGAPAFNLCWPPSSCPHCKQRLRWWHNIPLISFLLLKGRCYFCEKPISLCYPLVELCSGMLTASIYVYADAMHMSMLWLSAAYLFVWLLVAIAVIDWQTQLIPDELSLLLLWIGLFYNGVCNLIVAPSVAILGAIVGYLALWLVAALYRAVRKREGMGYGDFKLLAALGAWFGVWQLPFILFTSSVLALLAVLLRYMLQGRFSWQQQLPFGPFLAAAGFIKLLVL